MSNERNLVPFTSDQSRDEAVKNGRNGGKASGRARRKKADFRKALNALLTAKITAAEWQDRLAELGLESTLENAMLLAQILEALGGNTQAATFVAKYAGQSSEPEYEQRNRTADTALKKAHAQAITGEDTAADNDQVMDFIKAMRSESGDGTDDPVEQQAD